MEPQRAKAIAGIVLTMAAGMEGLRQYAYYCPAGVLTVCYGHTGDVVTGKQYTLAECKGLLEKDMLQAVNDVERCHPGLPEKIHAAFADAVFNVGPIIACGPSTASRLLAAKQYEAACNELPKWSKARVAGVLTTLPGLVRRRAAEQKLCLEGLPV